MKKITFILLVSVCIALIGCSVMRPGNKNQSKLNDAIEHVEKAKENINDNVKDQITEIQSLASGVNYALTKVTNPPPSVEVAMSLNLRTMSLAGTPTVDELVKMMAMVDDLTSQLITEKKRGMAKLSEKDKEISSIQHDKEKLATELTETQTKLIHTSDNIARTADKYQVTIDKVNSYFGLGAVFYGLKKFITTCFVSILIFSVIFLILRVFANTNPIAKAAMMVFDMIGSFVLHAVKAIIPNSFNIAKFTPSETFDKYKNTLTKIVDTIEEMKSHEDLKVEVKYTLSEVMDKFSKSLGDTDKGVVESILKELKWKV